MIYSRLDRNVKLAYLYNTAELAHQTGVVRSWLTSPAGIESLSMDDLDLQPLVTSSAVTVSRVLFM